MGSYYNLPFFYTGSVACLLKLLLDHGIHHEAGFAVCDSRSALDQL